MNWKEEIKRVDLDIHNVTCHDFVAYYTIEDVRFMVNIDFNKTTYDHETGYYGFDIDIVNGVWWTDEDPTDNCMEFSENYKQWMYGMIDYLVYEREFLHEYLTREDDYNYWSDYGI